MTTPLRRYGTWQIVAVYDTPAKLAGLQKEWTSYTRHGATFCPSGVCPFVPGTSFDYDLKNSLYYRARAITADITNLNGDLFEHAEILPTYETFVGKGVYFNHDSDSPDKAFGIILDAVYTPVLYSNDAYEDKYVELLCAIDRSAAREKRPGLIEDIETGKVTSTSMGTIAARAKCSICNNVASNMEQLCDHCHPQSPMYMKGRNVFGKMCYETNYGLSFIEDSIVYVPADPTAHMLEVYASKTGEHVNRLADLFKKYSLALGRKTPGSVDALTANFKSTGGLYMSSAPITVSAATSEVKHEKDQPGAPAVPKFQESIKNLNEEVADSAVKTLDGKIRRIVEEELRKQMAPTLEEVDKELRPIIRDKVSQEVAKSKTEIDQVLPEAGKEPAPAPATAQPAPAPTAMPKPMEAPKAAAVMPIVFTEDFASWTPEARETLVKAIYTSSSYEFKGEIALDEKGV